MEKMLDKKGLKLLKEFEGVRREVYLDIVGLKTIGVGHLIQPLDHFDEPLTDEDIDALLHKDLFRFYFSVNRLNKIKELTQDQFNVLVSLSFNIGVHAFENSTVYRK